MINLTSEILIYQFFKIQYILQTKIKNYINMILKLKKFKYLIIINLYLF